MRRLLDENPSKTHLDGRLLDFHRTGGQASDITQFKISLDIGPDIRPRIVVPDKGYDSATASFRKPFIA
ncbi:hypothetical protein [Rhodovastum atsumiense]|uniref:hypothetical protein n=1 Tax=Rhodovastum atsumiense TaxID=504468 RepID=UPI00139F2C00|nr:hypothetical protein [Rhodovastum atsumiense]